MASNSKYNIDVNKVRKPGNVGTSGIFIGTGSGNRESFYAVRGTGGGSVVIYDKVLYELEMNNITNVSAAGGNIALAGYVVKNKRTHGNGTADTGLALNPTSVNVPANTSTASTKTGNVTVTQFDDALNDYVGASVTISWTQEKDYPVSIAMSLGTPSDIPASGGNVSSVGNTVTCTYKSGNVRQLASSEYTVSWGTAVSAGSLNDTVKGRTKVGDLTATATYTCNGVTVTANGSVPVYQQENKIESTVYENPSISLSSPSVIASGGGSTQLSVSNCTQKYTRTYTSTYSSSGNVTTGFAYSWASSNSAFSVNPTTGASTTVSVQSNTGTTERNTTVTCTAVLNGKTGTTPVTVTQSGSYGFSVSPTAITFGNGAGSSALTITNPNGYNWTITGVPTWISASTTGGSAGGTVTLTVGANTGASRSATITVKDVTNNKSFSISISQDAPGYSFSVSPSSFSFASGVTTGVITITNPNGYSWTLTGLPAWISASTTAGTSNASITLRTTENTGASRTATITVKETTLGQTTKNITCTQEAKGSSLLTPVIDHIYHGYYYFSPENMSFDSAGTSQTLVIKSDSTHPWSANSWFLSSETPTNWVYLSQTAGVGDAVITVSAATNQSAGRRGGISFIKSYTPNANALFKSNTISLYQSGGTGPEPATQVLINYNLSSSGSGYAYGGQCEVYFGEENCSAGDSESSNNYSIYDTPLGGTGTLSATTSGQNVTFGVELTTLPDDIFSRIDISYRTYSDTGNTQAAITLPKSQVTSAMTANVTVYFQPK